MSKAKRYIPIHDHLDVLAARDGSRDLARALGFGVLDQARVALAVAELARNVVQYAERGAVILYQIGDHGQVGLEVVCEDLGPGIPDVPLALRGGPASGMGLPGAQRLVDEFEIESTMGVGTRVTIRKWLGTRPWVFWPHSSGGRARSATGS